MIYFYTIVEFPAKKYNEAKNLKEIFLLRFVL